MASGSSFSVDSLLNASRGGVDVDDRRLTPSSFATDSSDRGAGPSSGVASPLVDTATPGREPPPPPPNSSSVGTTDGTPEALAFSAYAVQPVAGQPYHHPQHYHHHHHHSHNPPAAPYPARQWQWQRAPTAGHHHHAHQPAAVDARFWPYPPQLMRQPAATGPPLPLPQPQPQPQQLYYAPHVPWRRERRSKACLRCHTKKIKCEGDGPVCDGCRLAGDECKWVEMKKRGPKPKKPRVHSPGDSAPEYAIDAAGDANPNPDPGPDPDPEPESATDALQPGPQAAQTATMEQVMRRFRSEHVAADTRDAVLCYLDCVYARIPIFHPATLVRRIAFGLVEPLLVDALKLCTARAVGRRTGRAAVDLEPLTASVHRRLLASVERPTLDYIRAVLLAASLLEGDSRFLMHNSLVCLATSLVLRLGWHTLDLGRGADEVPWDEWVELEEKRRTFWCAYQMDSYQSLLSDRPMTIGKTHIFISTPGSDYTWDDVSMPRIMHWPTRHQPDIHRDAVVRMGALSYTFIEHCSLAALASQIAEFLWEARADVLSHQDRAAWQARVTYTRGVPTPPPLPADRCPPASMFDYPDFRRLHDALAEWRAALIPADEIAPAAAAGCAPLERLEDAGSLESRRQAMRLRYFTLRCHYTPLLLLLHFTNRPSFYAADCQPARDVGDVVAFSPAADSGEDRALRTLMSAVFADVHNDGLLACDIADDSWRICVDECHALMAHLARNSDIPPDRLDASIAFCLFVAATVLIRHIRVCRQKIARLCAPAAAAAAGLGLGPGQRQQGIAATRKDMARAAAALRSMWATIKDLGAAWGTRDAEAMLRAMQIDQIAGAADLLL
ncbi:hypothetical protein H4R18_000967 [Coemansia javaensis]|uniref:Zn(2)-C6 fungal-type domain-containing protein n=1 Tax=Coemansia javaensis TaxID=2761396 RepID=A0A9W8HGL0_9FUNG|nr:hypothetical protein H4R18_000967 [Coemansia javaensis]